jgi:hypothetical protein
LLKLKHVDARQRLAFHSFEVPQRLPRSAPHPRYRPRSVGELRAVLGEAIRSWELRLIDVLVDPAVNRALVDKLARYWYGEKYPLDDSERRAAGKPAGAGSRRERLRLRSRRGALRSVPYFRRGQSGYGRKGKETQEPRSTEPARQTDTEYFDQRELRPPSRVKTG